MWKMLFKQIAKYYLETSWKQQGEYVILQRQQKTSLKVIYMLQKFGSMEWKRLVL